jgi:hypothetical protein
MRRIRGVAGMVWVSGSHVGRGQRGYVLLPTFKGRQLSMPGPGFRAIFRRAEVGTELPLSGRELARKQVDLPRLGDPPRQRRYHLRIVVDTSTCLLQGGHVDLVLRLSVG